MQLSEVNSLAHSITLKLIRTSSFRLRVTSEFQLLGLSVLKVYESFFGQCRRFLNRDRYYKLVQKGFHLLPLSLTLRNLVGTF